MMKKRAQRLTMISHKKSQKAQEPQKRSKVRSCGLGVFCASLRLLMIAVVVLMPLTAQASQAEVRTTVQGVFEQLKRSEEHTSELQSLAYLVCRLLLEK